MAQKYSKLNEKFKSFIQQQQMYFIGTADKQGRVNISPKGLDSFKIINDTQVMWLNLTGSGNETAAHVLSSSRMTILFMAFEDRPMILRLYGQAQVIHMQDKQWSTLYSQFEDFMGARQIFVLDIDTIISSCGMAVPIYEFKQQRDELLKSAERKGIEKIKSYWLKKNQLSIDGKVTNIANNL
jgi:hypothetical protein